MERNVFLILVVVVCCLAAVNSSEDVQERRKRDFWDDTGNWLQKTWINLAKQIGDFTTEQFNKFKESLKFQSKSYLEKTLEALKEYYDDLGDKTTTEALRVKETMADLKKDIDASESQHTAKMKVLFACLCLCLMISLSVQWHPRRRHTRPPRHTTTPEPTTTTTEPTTTTTEPTTTEPTTTTTEPTTTEPTTTTTTETTTKQSLIDLILEGLKKKFEETLYKILKFKKEKFVAILKGLVKLGKAAAKELLDLLHKWLLKHHDLPEDEDTRVQQMMYTLETYIEQGEDEDEHGIIDLILAGLKNKFEETIQKVIQLKKNAFESVVKNVARLGKAAAKKVLGYFANFLNKHHDLPGDGALRVSQMMDSLQTYVDEDENEKTLSRGKRFVGRIIDGLIKEKVEFVQEALKLKKEKFVEVVHGLGKLAKGAAKKVFGFFRRFIGGHHDLPGDGALRISEMMGAAETAAENNPDEVPTSGAVFPLMSVATTLVTLLIALFV